MAILPIRIMGDPVLHTPAATVTDFDDSLRQLVADMFETMDAAPGVGLAAPQVGVGLRLFTYGYGTDDTGEPWRGVVINPDLLITPPDPGEPDEDTESEGCLSFPGERFPLRRAEQALITGVDVDQNPVSMRVDGWRARILQHEFDHLNGYLYVDRLDDRDYKTVSKIARKRGWDVPGVSWLPGLDDLDA
ncbi:peptide deformylase [Okibacterium endophyticum]